MYALSPPRALVEEMRRYDAQLNLRFDPGKNRWCVTRTVKTWRGDLEGSGFAWTDTVEVHVFDVEEPDGSFRPADRRIMRQLYYGDLLRIGPENAARALDTIEHEERAAKKRALSERIKDSAREHHNMLYGARWQVPERVKKFADGLRRDAIRDGAEG